jgi:glycine betaine catabolism A
MTHTHRLACSDAVRIVAEDCAAGWTLPRRFYVDPGIFAADLDAIHRRHWLLAGPSCRIRRAGDHFTWTIGDDSIVILRDEEGTARAFHNVCRHRGSRICLESDGHAKRLVCPYHAWSYRLDGSVAAARHLPKEADLATLGLHPVGVREVCGLIFICFSQRPPDFDATARDIDKFFAAHGLESTQICRRTVETIRANWKVVAENFWECYHCAATHPEFCGVMSYAHAANNDRLAAERREFERLWDEQTRARGGRTGQVQRTPAGLHQGGRIPIRPGYVTQSKNGRPVAPLLGTATDYDGGVTSFTHLPIIWYLACNDHAMLARFTPRSVLETELELTWLVHENAVEGRDFDTDEVAWLWSTTAAQDKTICENNQLGILSSRYQPGPLTSTEGSVAAFHAWYLGELLADSRPYGSPRPGG